MGFYSLGGGGKASSNYCATIGAISLVFFSFFSIIEIINCIFLYNFKLRYSNGNQFKN
jgi:hypothetical protein